MNNCTFELGLSYLYKDQKRSVLKQFFCNKFVTFHRRSKRIAFLESVDFSK